MRVFYYDHHDFPLPPNHRFPKDKYRLLREAIEHEETIAPDQLIPGPEIIEQDLFLAHDPAYVAHIRHGTLSPQHEREMGLPWSAGLAKRVRHTVGATVAAAHAALIDGIASTTGGGTHHAQWDRPQGYCLFNDAAVAARVMQRDTNVERVLIIDCDVHQGNGTALILGDDPTTFTFSIHCQKNFPVRKAQSDLDIGLDEGIGDQPYLEALSDGLSTITARFAPDLVIYLAGADPHHGDRLGRLNLTRSSLRRRDQLVFQHCRAKNWPVAITLAGGYGHNIADTVDIYHQTIRIATKFSD